MKIFTYEDQELYVDKEVEDKNGFLWKIIACGPKQVKAVLLDKPTVPPSYVAHWFFVKNIIRGGRLTERFL